MNKKTQLNLLEEPAFLDDEGPSVDVPTHISTANIRELFGWQSGDTLKEAVTHNDCAEPRKCQ